MYGIDFPVMWAMNFYLDHHGRWPKRIPKRVLEIEKADSSEPRSQEQILSDAREHAERCGLHGTAGPAK